MRDFMFDNNGSKQFQKLKENSGQSNIDLVQFWKVTDKSKGLDLKTDRQKYVWCFTKLEPESFTVSTSQLEKFIMTTTRKNVDARADQMIVDLNNVYKEIVEMSTNDDPDKSFEIEYSGKVIISTFHIF